MSLNPQDLPPSDMQDSKLPTLSNFEYTAQKEGGEYASMQSAYSPSQGSSCQKEPGQGLQGCSSVNSLVQSYEPPNQVITEIRPSELSLVESATEDELERLSDGQKTFETSVMPHA